MHAIRIEGRRGHARRWCVSALAALLVEVGVGGCTCDKPRTTIVIDPAEGDASKPIEASSELPASVSDSGTLGTDVALAITDADAAGCAMIDFPGDDCAAMIAIEEAAVRDYFRSIECPPRWANPSLLRGRIVPSFMDSCATGGTGPPSAAYSCQQDYATRADAEAQFASVLGALKTCPTTLINGPRELGDGTVLSCKLETEHVAADPSNYIFESHHMFVGCMRRKKYSPPADDTPNVDAIDAAVDATAGE